MRNVLRPHDRFQLRIDRLGQDRAPVVMIDNFIQNAEELVEDAVYAPYLARQDRELRDLRAGEALRLGGDFPFAEIAGLSREMIERLSAARPATLAAAGRVPGVTPAALAALLVHARRREGGVTA